MPWNDERIEYVRLAWARGDTAMEISIELNRSGARSRHSGISRNAVMGLVHRKGFVRAGEAPRPPRPPAPPRKKAPQNITENITGPVAEVEAAEAVAPVADQSPPSYWCEGDPVSILQLGPRHCRSVVETRDEYGVRMYCGKQKTAGLPYCSDCAVSYGLRGSPAQPPPWRPRTDFMKFR